MKVPICGKECRRLNQPRKSYHLMEKSSLVYKDRAGPSGVEIGGDEADVRVEPITSIEYVT